jgi:hypothetical protein
MATKTNLTVQLQGKGSVKLGQQEYVASGGEGSIYRLGNVIVKIFHDPDGAIKNGKQQRIETMAKFQHESIIAPQGLVYDDAGKTIGFYMPYATGEPLTRAFTTAFRQRENFGDAEANVTVKKMMEVVRYAHGKNALLIDPNALNWVVDIANLKDPIPRVMDVDSWVIGPMPPTVAVMESIRDYHARQFGRESDWFAMAVVTFELYTGTHPYRGTLAGYDGTALEKMQRRMRDNKSVFTPGVSLNSAVRSFDCIPKGMLHWYREVLDKGVRVAPPTTFDAVVAQAARIMQVTITAQGNVTFDKIYKGPKRVIAVWPCGIVLLEDNSLYNLNINKEIGRAPSSRIEIVESEGGWLLVEGLGASSRFFFIESSGNFAQTELTSQLTYNRVIRFDQTLYFVTDNAIVEARAIKLGKVTLGNGKRWSIMVNACQFFDGVIVQDALGAMHLSLRSGAGFVQPRVKELDGCKVVNAKAKGRFVSVIVADKTGGYERIEFTFDEAMATYTVLRSPVTDSELNTVILDKGACVSIVRDGELVLSLPTKGVVQPVSSSNIKAGMVLGHWSAPDKAVVIYGHSLFTVTVTKK